MNQEAFYEFIYMKRLFGNKTYDHDTRFLDSASILRYATSSGRLDIAKYWQPNCNISEMSMEDASDKLAFLMKESFKRLSSDSKRYGLLLSGGLDSRSILAASDVPLTCITTCEYMNNEYMVAKELSRAKGYEHIFIEKPSTYYSDIIDKAVYTGAGMTLYTGAHFFNIEDVAREKIDVFLHGYGFDFLFRGKYLPNTVHPLLSKLTYRRNLIPIGIGAKDVAEEFIENISYRLDRLKSVNSAMLLKYRARKGMLDALYCESNKIINEAKTLSDDPYKWWDYCCFRNVSRHYTWLNILSLRTFIEERTAAFDNDLFDFFWSLDPLSRLNGDIFVGAIKLLDPNVFKVRNANTNLSLGDPSFVTSSKIVLNKALKETGLNKLFKRSLPFPLLRERSWPIDADLIRENEKIRELTLGLCDSSELETLSFLNMDVVGSCICDHLDGKGDYTNLILTFLTVDRFLKQA